MVFAGMDNGHINKLSWIYSTQRTWTMTPQRFSQNIGNAYEWVEHSAGHLANWNVNDSLGARPVINLKANVEISGGTGTANEPFIVETN